MVGGRPRVLFVDDDESLRQLYARVLEMAGYAVVVGDNGARARELFLTEEIDLIVLDLMMPVLDGLGFLRWLRQEEQSEVPVLMLSAVGQPGIRASLFEAGANEVLVKPVGVSELLAKIAVLCEA